MSPTDVSSNTDMAKSIHTSAVLNSEQAKAILDGRARKSRGLKIDDWIA